MPRTNAWGALATRKYSIANRAQHSTGILALAYVHMGLSKDVKPAVWVTLWVAVRAAVRAGIKGHGHR